MDRSPTAFFVLMSALAVFVGVVCILVALVTAVLDTTVFALTSTYIQVAIASFLVAIWFGILGMVNELRHHSRPGMA